MSDSKFFVLIIIIALFVIGTLPVISEVEQFRKGNEICLSE